MVESTIKNPTVDCEKCNFTGTDEDGEFRCKWRYPKPVIPTEDNRCFHVVKINKIYEKAVENRKKMEREGRI